MKHLSLTFLTLFTFLSFITTAQKQTGLTAGKKKYTIPFSLTAYNNIVIKAVLNKEDTVNLMLHTASGDVTITEDALAHLKTLKFNGTVDSVKSWGGSGNSSDFSKNNSLTIAGMSWDSVTVWKDEYSGQQTDGKFGLNLFENKIVVLDFDKNLLTVTTKLPPGMKKYNRFKLITTNDDLFITAVCKPAKDTFQNSFLIHSGYAGDILLDDEFVKKNNIGQQIKITGEKKLEDAYGNTLVTKKGILPVFKIGNLQLANVPVGFFEGAIGRQKMSIIGGDILKRFDWIIDAKRKYIYLKPSNLFNTKYDNS